MASLASTALDLALELEWYDIRDTLGVENGKQNNPMLALELALTCEHPDSRFLTETFAGTTVSTKEQARTVLLQCRNDARALCFAAVLSVPLDVALLHRSAQLGYAFAQAFMAWRAEGEEGWALALKAAEQGERDAFHCLGFRYSQGIGCEKDFVKAKENYLRAAMLNHIGAMIAYGTMSDAKTDPERWHWWGLAAIRGNGYCFLHNFVAEVELFTEQKSCVSIAEKSSLRRVVFLIGRTLKGQVDLRKKQIFGVSQDFNLQLPAATSALDFYHSQCLASRSAVDMWTRAGMRLGVARDIRIVISKLIWDQRELALYFWSDP